MRRIALLALFLPAQDAGPLDWKTLIRQVEALASDDPAERAAARASIALQGKQADTIARCLDNPPHRRAAAAALGLLGDRRAKPVLDQLAKDKDPVTRIIAFEAMSGLPPDAGALFKALEEEPRVALAAARTLGSFNADAGIMKRLSDLWAQVSSGKSSRSRRLQIAVAVAFASQHDAYLQMATRHLADDDRDTAAMALVAVYQRPVPPGRMAGPELFRQARSRADLRNSEREMAALILLRLDSMEIDDVISMLNDPSATVRHAARERVLREGPRLDELDTWLLRHERGTLPEELEELLVAWIEKASGLKPPAARAERSQAWKAWLVEGRRRLLDLSVGRAIDRGSDWLEKMFPENEIHGHPGSIALATYTLLKCGAGLQDPGVARGLAHLQKTPIGGVYDAAIRAMAFGEALALRPAPDRETTTEASRDPLRKGLDASAAYLVRAQLANGAWSYQDAATGAWAGVSWYDHSNMQFAVLGLRAAANAGAKIPERTWERAAKHLVDFSPSGGGWGYQKDAATWNMTCGGLSALLIARSSLTGKAPSELLREDRVATAFRWLREHYEFPGKGRADRVSNFYGLWSGERAFLIAGMEKLGDHDWYVDGAVALVGQQGADGSWTGQYQSTVDTCLALLFLKRAYVPVATPGTPRKPGNDVATPSAEDLRKK